MNIENGSIWSGEVSKDLTGGTNQYDAPAMQTRGSEQAGSASAVPGGEEHGDDRELVDGGAFPERKGRRAGRAPARPARALPHSA